MKMYLLGIVSVLILVVCLIRKQAKVRLRQRGLSAGERLIDVPVYIFGTALFCLLALWLFAALFPAEIDALTFLVLLLLSGAAFWLSVYASRWFVIYDGEGFWFQTAFRKCRRFDYAAIVSFRRFIKDARIRVGRRLIYFDQRQDWGGFEQAYRNWQRKNGIEPPPRKQYRTALGKNLDEIEGGVELFVVTTAACAVGAVLAFFLAALLFSAKGTGYAVGFCIAGLLLILLNGLMALAMSNPEKHKKLFGILWKGSLYDRNRKK